MRRKCELATISFAVVLVVGIVVHPASANPFSDFDDGTLQGWTPDTSGGPFGGQLDHVAAGGNPGGYMRATDTAAGDLPIAAPTEFNGDLSVYAEIRWDEFLFNNPQIAGGTSVTLVGSDDTAYRSAFPVNGVGVWQPRSVALLASKWTLVSGTQTFEQVLADATMILNMDVSITTFPTLESGIDNIALIVPEPGAGLILLLGVAVMRRRGIVR